jgi:hypothetical protein
VFSEDVTNRSKEVNKGERLRKKQPYRRLCLWIKVTISTTSATIRSRPSLRKKIRHQLIWSVRPSRRLWTISKAPSRPTSGIKRKDEAGLLLRPFFVLFTAGRLASVDGTTGRYFCEMSPFGTEGEPGAAISRYLAEVPPEL